MMKVYLSGKIHGDRNYKEKFAAAAELVRAIGYEPLNPANAQSGMTNSTYMRMAFAMIDECKYVFLLPDWCDSQGARIERLYADYTGCTVATLESVIDAYEKVLGQDVCFSEKKKIWEDVKNEQTDK